MMNAEYYVRLANDDDDREFNRAYRSPRTLDKAKKRARELLHKVRNEYPYAWPKVNIYNNNGFSCTYDLVSIDREDAV